MIAATTAVMAAMTRMNGFAATKENSLAIPPPKSFIPPMSLETPTAIAPIPVVTLPIKISSGPMAAVMPKIVRIICCCCGLSLQF